MRPNLDSDHPIEHPAAFPIQRLQDESDIKRTRASGPGGQHRNKVETAIVITHRPTGVVGQASESRSQERNRQAAWQRLKLNLALAVRVQRTEISPLWLARRSGKRIEVNPEHPDFPALLAETLDQIHIHDYDVASAAQSLGVSTSQLVKLVKKVPAAWQAVNQERESLGLHRLK